MVLSSCRSWFRLASGQAQDLFGRGARAVALCQECLGTTVVDVEIAGIARIAIREFELAGINEAVALRRGRDARSPSVCSSRPTLTCYGAPSMGEKIVRGTGRVQFWRQERAGAARALFAQALQGRSEGAHQSTSRPNTDVAVPAEQILSPGPPLPR